MNNRFTIILQRRRVAIINISKREVIKVLDIADRSSDREIQRKYRVIK